MPILDIEVIVVDGETTDSDWVQQIADGAGKIFGTLPGKTWVRVRRLPNVDYAENETKISPDLRPVFVSVLKSQLPPIDVLRVESRKLTLEVARIMQRPAANVHVLYLPPAAGRLSFGGTLLEESA